MKNKKDLIQIVLLGIITIILFAGLVLIAVHFKKVERENNTQNIPENQSNEKENKQEESTFQENIDHSTSIPNQSTPNSTTKPNTGNGTENITPSNPSPTPNQDSSQNKNETDVVSYFENLDYSVATYQDENNPTFREKVKNAFTTVVDFLFYDSTIHGYTFKELTTSAKLKVLKVALKIDNKIDSYFPNYKTTIKSKMQNLKGKAALLYLETTSKLCESVGESACNEARADFKNMKESFGFTWDIIKSGASSSYTSLKTILSEWYQSIK